MVEAVPTGSVRFTLAERQLKLFKNALQSLNKIGSELLVEALTGRLILRTINAARSAYMSVTLDARFFDEYHVFDCTVVQAGILMKHILSTFRTQRVSKIVFELRTDDSQALVTLTCDNGLVKSYQFPSLEAEILQATVDKDAFPTCVVTEAGAMDKLLSSFSSGLEEVTIIAYGGSTQAQGQGAAASSAVQLHSFLDPQKGHVDKSLFTQLAVNTQEVFLSYNHNSDSEADVTFNLKDFKAMLSLCEHLGSNVMLSFEGPGQPLVVQPHFPTLHGQEVDYEAELILATLMESHSLPQMADGGGQQQQQQQQQQSFPMGAAAAAAAGGGGAGAADIWLAPGTSGPSHFLPGEQALAQSGGRVPRSTARGGGRRRGQLDSPSLSRRGREDSPQLVVPSGLLDDPFRPDSPADSGHGAAGAAQQPAGSFRSRPSRLGPAGQQAAVPQPSFANGGSSMRMRNENGIMDREDTGWDEEDGMGEDEIPGTPPDEQQQQQQQQRVQQPLQYSLQVPAGALAPGAIPTAGAASLSAPGVIPSRQ